MPRHVLKLNPLIAALTVFCAEAWSHEVTLLSPSAKPWTNRYTTQGLAGGQSQLSGFVDAMVPVFGTGNKLWFVDGSFFAGERNNHVLSLGAGARHLLSWGNNGAILGGYLFADNQHIKKHGQAWLLNPGIELLFNNYELRVQGYFPVEKRQHIYATLMASQLPQSYLNYTRQSVKYLALGKGHSWVDTPVGLTTQIGNGGEAEAGVYIPLLKGGWLRGGGYYFDFPNARKVSGVQANVEIYFNRNASILLQNNYDNQNKNRFSVGLRYSFGGPDHTQVNQISNRMEEPIIRHQARQSYGLVTPVREAFVPTGATFDLASNVWFFSPLGMNQAFVDFSSCTADNPCSDLSQSVIDGINSAAPNASLWLATGTYALPSTTGTNGFIYLYNGQSLFGRTFDFSQPASGTNRPLIVGGLWWLGTGALADLQVNNTNQVIPAFITGTGYDAVAAVGARGSILAKDVALFTTGTGAPKVFGLYTGDNAVVDALSINVSATPRETANSSDAYGILSQDQAIALNSIISVTNQNAAGSAYAVSGNNGVVVGSSFLNVQGSGDIFYAGVSSGLDLFLYNSVIQQTGKGTQYGLYGLNDVTVLNSLIELSSSDDPIGVFAQNIAKIFNSNIRITDTATKIFNNYAVSANSIFAYNSTFSVISNIGQAWGLFAQNNIFAQGVAILASSGAITTLDTAPQSAIGILSNTGSIQVLGSQIFIIGNGQLFGVSSGSGPVGLSATNISVTSSNSGSVVMTGVSSLNNNVALENSSIKMSGSSANNILGVQGQTLQLLDSSIQANSNGASSLLGAFATGTTTITNTSITATGSTTSSIIGVLNTAQTQFNNSNVTVQGTSSSITGVSSLADLVLNNSTVNVLGEGVTISGVSVSSNFSLDNSTIKVNSTGEAPLLLVGINGSTLVGSTTGSLLNSSVNVSGNVSGLGAYGMLLNGPVGANVITTLNGSSIDVANTNSTPGTIASGITALTSTNEIDFTGNASSITVTGQTASAISLTPGVVNNQSTPPSSCTVNGVTNPCS
ncbi:beta strand repeat-containing protein [Legionella maceachernii]|uniref:Inverse autotransporter beta-domain domain-containing protein n=1 Tax=Legionella maceachernii TaxID=466 RepID=A0A0W0VXY6_9GAMM|nr:hypothetical protein [Legionella maceachernii]KTD24841.1 hypothetical protein Lmac_2378 [Legionella maceachernii]SKA22518.1 hypothetical protein SAMN02745128_02667 [Legionella maceachernii]SUP01474.1 Uncharacterised protein [Legionella maceachernii]